MPENKVNCLNCGTYILERTSLKNEGLCVACKSEKDIRHKLDQNKIVKEAKFEANKAKRRIMAIIFISSFVLLIFSGGIYFNYQDYIQGKDPIWLPISGIIVNIIIIAIHIYRFIYIIKTIKNENT